MASHHRSKRHECTILERFYRANRELEKIVLKITECDDDNKDNLKLRSDARLLRRKMFDMLRRVMDDAIPVRMRTPRHFRLKYTDEIRTDNLDSQLWQAIEVIASGQVIMHRESLSETLRPLATTILDLLSEVRATLSCEFLNPDYVQLRHKARDCSRRLVAANRDPNTQEQAQNSPGGVSTGSGGAEEGGSTRYPSSYYYSCEVMEMLAQLDELLASFEWEYMKVVVRKMRSPQEAQDLQETAVLFSETVLWAQRRGLLTFTEIAECDTQLMLTLPRLAVIMGCRLHTEGVMIRALDRDANNRPYLFRKFSAEISFLRRHLGALTPPEFVQLSRYLALQDDTPAHQQHTASEPSPLLSSTSSDSDEESESAGGGESRSNGEVGSSGRRRLQHKQQRRCQRQHISHLIGSHRKVVRKLPSGPLKLGDMQSLFKLVSHISDALQSEFAAEYRFLMQVVFVLYQDSEDNLTPTSVADNGMDTTWRELGDQHAELDKNLTKEEELKCDQAMDALELIRIVGCEEDLLEGGSDLPLPGTSSQEDDEDRYLIAHLDQCLNKFPSTQTGENSQSSADSKNKASSLLLKSDWMGFNVPTGISTNPRQRPAWQNSIDTSECCHCERRFLFFRRRHHCRRCGYVFCSSCWGQCFPIPQMGIETPVPVCIECALILDGCATPGSSTMKTTS